MSTGTRIPLAMADSMAAELVAMLEPHCEPGRIVVAGSIRRRRPTIGDIEVVCIPRPYDATPLFCSGIASIVNNWDAVKGELPCRYTQRLLPCGLKLDLFMPDPQGFGLQVAIRTGSAEWSHRRLAAAWVRAGYRSEGGVLRDHAGRAVPTPDEQSLFRLIALPWVEPENREVPGADPG